jgi:hypothetical protein
LVTRRRRRIRDSLKQTVLIGDLAAHRTRIGLHDSCIGHSPDLDPASTVLPWLLERRTCGGVIVIRSGTIRRWRARTELVLPEQRGAGIGSALLDGS